MSRAKRKKVELSVETGTIVHPSSKQRPHHHIAQPMGQITAPVEVVRTDRATGKVTHVNGLQVESK